MLPTLTIAYAIIGIVSLAVMAWLHFEEEDSFMRILITVITLIAGAPALVLFFLLKRYFEKN